MEVVNRSFPILAPSSFPVLCLCNDVVHMVFMIHKCPVLMTTRADRDRLAWMDHTYHGDRERQPLWHGGSGKVAKGCRFLVTCAKALRFFGGN